MLIIDDASPDGRTHNVLDDWQKRQPGRWRFHFNPVNLGFPATANLGMSLAAGDVVLLNSDTIVTPGWLEGLLNCLASGSDIATATPWTNNGEIASIPGFCKVNPVPPDLTAVADVIRRCGTPAYPELPTAVGFCMAVTRASIEKIGLFDQALFGRGYGEENDF